MSVDRMDNSMAGGSTDQYKSITLRAVIIAFALIPLNSYWIARALMVWSASPTYISMFYNVIFCMTALTIMSFAIKRVSKRSMLSWVSHPP